MTEINSLSTRNYNSLGNYNGLNNISKRPNTLGNISNEFTKYPVQSNFQIVPEFAGTGDYSKPNYNVLNKGSCYNYAGINKAYIDCSNPDSKQACDLNGGNCVKYISRQCN
jgi:hypothetical protein